MKNINLGNTSGRGDWFEGAHSLSLSRWIRFDCAAFLVLHKISSSSFHFSSIPLFRLALRTKMKIKTISRLKADFVRPDESSVFRSHRNPDPKLNPFEKQKEYSRAVNAAKLNKIFAKPFLGSMEHNDGVTAMATNPKSLVSVLSGSADGEIRMWDLASKKQMWSAVAHSGFVRGISVSADGERAVTCSDDKTVKMWDVHAGQDYCAADDESDDEGEASSSNKIKPMAVLMTSSSLWGVDCNWRDDTFATCGSCVEVWDATRAEPVVRIPWGCDTVSAVRFNPAERSLIASASSDRNITLYDIRANKAIKRVFLTMRTNAICWNPMEPFNFTVANEDTKLYSFDMRKLERATMVHKDHVNAVMDLSYSPTGEEFATASYDRTVRIFPRHGGRSREVYHTKRMQRVFCVRFSQDAKFVLSGSDDTNVRIWKAQASMPLARLAPRQRQKIEYNQKLIQRYKHMREVRSISKSRRLPKNIKKAAEIRREVESAAKVREERRRKHEAKTAGKRKAERQKSVLKVVD